MKNKQYGLKTINADYTSCNGFKYPKKGIVIAKDWNNKKECGNGLHFALNGEGNGRLFKWDEKALWVVAELLGEIIDLDGKVKCEKAKIIYIGDRETATEKIKKLCHKSKQIIGSKNTGGDGSKNTGGDRSILQWKYFDRERYRIHTEYVGENGIKPNVKYLGKFENEKFIVEEVNNA